MLVAAIRGNGAYSCITYDNNKHIIYDAIMGFEDGYDGIHAETYKDTTNNRMEIKGLIAALELATNKYKEEECTIYCDSAYCVNMFNSWISNWASNNWIGSSKEQVKNLDLVKQLYKYKLIDFPNFQVTKINGHEGEIGNELADAYATAKVYGNSTKLVKIITENDITLEIG